MHGLNASWPEKDEVRRPVGTMTSGRSTTRSYAQMRAGDAHGDGRILSLVMIFAYNGYSLREWADAAADNVRAPILFST